MKKKRIKNRKLLDEIKSGRCLICGQKSDPCHVKSRGAGGDDIYENVIPMCRPHHQYQHKNGWSSLIEKYPLVEVSLNDRGWVLEKLFGRTRLVRKENGIENNSKNLPEEDE